MVQQLSEAASTFPEAVLVSPYDKVSLQKINNNVPHNSYSSGLYSSGLALQPFLWTGVISCSL